MAKASDPKKPVKKAADGPKSQSDIAKQALEKLQSAKAAKSGAPGGLKKPGFDPNQLKGGGKAFGGGGNQMMRRTQGKGGGGGGGAGSGGGGNV
jgi:hypothetical protein